MDAVNNETNAKLKCPECGYAQVFYVYADTRIKVDGADFTTVLDEGDSLEYDSNSTCTCPKCNHTSTMGDFYAH